MQSSETYAGIFGLLMILTVVVIGIALFALWLWMLIHAITNKGLKDTEKLLWVLLIVFLPFLGSILYFFIGRPKTVVATSG